MALRRLRNAFLASALLLASAPSAAYGGFQVFPSIVDVESDAGKAKVGTFNLQLNGERGRRFRVEVEDLSQASDGSFRYRDAGSGSRYSAATWISALPRSFDGGPDRVQPIEYRVRIPRNAAPGDYGASLTVKRSPTPGGSASIVQAISVRLNVRVRGKTRERAEIENLEVPKIAGKGPITVSATIRNKGNTRLVFGRRNRGALEIVDQAKLAFRGVLLPGERRRFDLRWEDPPLTARPRARVQLEASGRRLTSDSSAFWVVPWRQAGAILLIALAFLILLRGRRRSRAEAT